MRAGCIMVQVSENHTNEREFLRCQSKMTNESSYDFPRIKRKRVSKYSMIGYNKQKSRTKKFILSKKLIKVMFDIKKEDLKKITIFSYFSNFWI